MRGSKRQDALRIRTILQLLTDPLEESSLSTEVKLWMVMAPQERPISRRKILRPMPVTGFWWMDESQWLRFLWQGHSGQVIRHDDDQDRVLATRTFKPGYCFVRENSADWLDLEAISSSAMWDPVKKKRLGTTSEWLTVTITREEYGKLDRFLGPPSDGCRHEVGEYDPFVQQR